MLSSVDHPAELGTETIAHVAETVFDIADVAQAEFEESSNRHTHIALQILGPF